MKRSEIAVLPSPQEILRARARNAELDRQVRQTVAEILAARDELVFEPFFRSRQVAYELKRLQSVPEQKKWHVFFECHGCMRCQTTERVHGGNGFCDKCYAHISATLKRIIRELMSALGQDRTSKVAANG